jgi:flagellar export protein FliJ
MKAFQFRLEAVLTLREQAEQAAQQACARAYAAVEAAAARLRSAEAAIATAEQTQRAHLAAGPRAEQLEQLRAFTVLLRERRVLAERELAEAGQRADAAWSRLLLATQQREALERMRGRQRRLHDYETARAEQKVLDERSGRGPALAGAWRESVADV